VTLSPAHKNIFQFYSKNSFKSLNIAQIKQKWNFYTMVIGNSTDKYVKYILVYINIKIVETWKYDLSCMRYYIEVAYVGHN